MGNRVKAWAASFQDFALILERKIMYFFLKDELAAGVFEASLYLKNKQTKQEKDTQM